MGQPEFIPPVELIEGIVRPIVPNVTSATPSRFMSPIAAVDSTACVLWLGSPFVALNRPPPTLSRADAAPGGEDRRGLRRRGGGQQAARDDCGGHTEARRCRAMRVVTGHARTSCPRDGSRRF